MSERIYLYKSLNVSVLLYHFVCPVKYRRVVFDKSVDETLVSVCLDISKRYEVHFLTLRYSIPIKKHSYSVAKGDAGRPSPLHKTISGFGLYA